MSVSGDCRKGENEHLTPRAATDSPVTQTHTVKAGCWCRRTLSSWDKASPTPYFALQAVPTPCPITPSIHKPAASTADLICVPDATVYGHLTNGALAGSNKT